MIDLHYWTTPNGHKIVMHLEETGTPYKIVPVDLSKGDQQKPDFLRIAPNNKIPAIVDHDPESGAAAVSIFESGAILLYLAEKTGKLLSTDLQARFDALQWVFWQVGGLGPMAGQLVNYKRSEFKNEHAIERFSNETARLYGVMNRRLEQTEYLGGDEFSIADVAAYPWAAPYNLFEMDPDQFPHVERWLDAVGQRPATLKAYALAKKYNANAVQPPVSRSKTPA
jgi:GSH-dependent disulfide-bond oxidoreductase